MPVEMLRLQTYRSPIPTLKMPIIQQENQGMTPYDKHYEKIPSRYMRLLKNTTSLKIKVKSRRL